MRKNHLILLALLVLVPLFVLSPNFERKASAQDEGGKSRADLSKSEEEERDDPIEREKFWEIRRNGITADKIAAAREKAARLPKSSKLPRTDGGGDASDAAGPVARKSATADAVTANAVTPNGSWTSIGPAPIKAGGAYYSGRVPAITAAPGGVVYLGGANGGVWKSADAGGNWTPMTNESNQKTLAIASIAVNPNNPNIVYAGTGEPNGGTSKVGRGVFKSVDGGGSWTLVGDGDPFTVGGTYTYRVLVHPDNSVYVASNFGLHRSSDGGTTWKRVKALPNNLVYDFAISPNGQRIFAVVQTHGVYASNDGGSTWVRLGNGLPGDLNGTWTRRARIAIAPHNTNYAYLLIDPNSVSAPSTVYYTTDGGNIWRLMSQSPNVSPTYGGYSMEMGVDPLNENILYVLGFGVAVNTAAASGGGWSSVPSLHPDHHAISFPACSVAPCPFYVGNDGGAFFVQPNGDPTNATVTSLNKTLALTEFVGGDLGNNFVSDPRAIGGSQDNGTQVWVPTDPQNDTPYTWIHTLDGDGGYAYFEHNPSGPWNAYAEQQNGCSNVNFPGLFKSTFWGYSWGGFCNGLLGLPTYFYAFYAPDRGDPSHLAFAANNGVYEIMSPQSSWYLSGNLGKLPLAIAVAPTHQIIYAGTAADSSGQPTFFRTSNAYSGAQATYVGRNGSGATALPTNFTVNSIAIDTQDASYNTVFVAGAPASALSPQSVYMTANGGVSWTNVSGNLPTSLPAYSVITYRAGAARVVVIGTEVGVFYTTNDGQTWVNFNAGLPATKVSQLAIDADQTTIAAFTGGRGAFTTNIGGGASCVYGLSSSGQNFPPGGGAGSVGVTANPSSCAWNATSSQSWVTITSGASGAGNGTVNFSVAANTGAASRSATLTIAGQTFNVTQDGAGGGTLLTPSSATASSSCADAPPSLAIDRNTTTSWNACGFPPQWIQLNFSQSYTISRVRLLVNEQPEGFTSVDIYVGGVYATTVSGNMTKGQWLDVTLPQPKTGNSVMVNTTSGPSWVAWFEIEVYGSGGGSCAYSLTPQSASVGSGGVNGNTVAVSPNPSGCGWTAASNVNWINITSGASGTGAGTVTYNVAANASTASRTGSMTIAGQTFNVTQDGASGGGACTVTAVDSGYFSFTAEGGSVPDGFAVSPAGCAWTATSFSPWISVNPQSGNGTGSVFITVAPNPGPSYRTGVVTINNVNVQVVQDF